MHPLLHRTLSILTATCLAACTTTEPPSTQPLLPDPAQSPACTADAQPTPLGFDLFLRLAGEQPDNLCFSPYAAHAAIALARPGARGETLRQIDRTIGSIGNLAAQTRTTSLPLEIANLICIEKTLEPAPSYKQTLPAASYLEADFINSPDRERTAINKWVTRRTHGHIGSLLPPNSITPLTRMALVNAIYTKAEWAHPFDKTDTWNQTFHPEQGSPFPCPTLHDTHSYRYLSLPDCEAIAIPFQHRQDKQPSCLIAILPAKGIPIRQYLATLTPAALQNIRTSLATVQPDIVKLDIPKFKLESSSDLSAALASTGMPDAFDPVKADFSGMIATATPLAIEQILQKCSFEMSEEGVTATASTAFSMAYQCAPAPEPKHPPHFKADRPFIWIIADLDPETTPYFIGTLCTPDTAN